MYVIRDVFRCKPGQSRKVADIFKAAFPLMEQSGNASHGRVLLDMVADYWTVVLEFEVKDLATYEREMEGYATREDLRKATAGYMDLVDGGRREIFRVV